MRNNLPIRLLLVLTCLLSGAVASHAQIITTYAGTDSSDYSGDSGPAINARMRSPYGVAVDRAGNVFVSDFNSNCIRKISPTGTISTIAGAGTGRGYSGDGRKAVDAQLNGPASIAVDTFGNLYFADYYNNVIRMVASNDTIYTIVGTGQYGYNGDGRQGRTAWLNKPSSIAVDEIGNIYIADKYNFRIRKVSRSTGVINTVAGTGVGGYSGDNGAAGNAKMCPHEIAITPQGDIYITDSVSSVYRVIRKISARGEITHFRANWATALGADRSGGVYFSDASCYVRKAYSPQRMAIIGGKGVCETSGDGGRATEGGINQPMGIAFDAARSAYVAEYAGHRVRKITYDPAAVDQVNDIATDLRVMPNPASESFVLEMPYAEDEVVITIADMAGRTVATKVVKAGSNGIKETIDVRNYIPGIYIITAIAGDQVFHAKVSVR